MHTVKVVHIMFFYLFEDWNGVEGEDGDTGELLKEHESASNKKLLGELSGTSWNETLLL